MTITDVDLFELFDIFEKNNLNPLLMTRYKHGFKYKKYALDPGEEVERDRIILAKLGYYIVLWDIEEFKLFDTMQYWVWIQK